MLRNFIAFVFHSHLILFISSFVFSYGVLGKNEVSFSFSIGLAMAVYGVYNLHRLIKLKRKELQPFYISWYEKNRIFHLGTSIIAIALSSVFYLKSIKFSIPISILVGISVLLTFFYLMPINGKKWRDFSNAKAFFVAWVWTLMAIVLPKTAMSTFSIADISYFFLFFALTIPGDIRDQMHDKSELKTIPQRFGNQIAICSMIFLIMVFSITQYFVFYDHLWLFILMLLKIIYLFSIFIKSSFELKYELMDVSLFIVGLFHLLSNLI